MCILWPVGSKRLVAYCSTCFSRSSDKIRHERIIPRTKEKETTPLTPMCIILWQGFIMWFNFTRPVIMKDLYQKRNHTNLMGLILKQTGVHQFTYYTPLIKNEACSIWIVAKIVCSWFSQHATFCFRVNSKTINELYKYSTFPNMF